MLEIPGIKALKLPTLIIYLIKFSPENFLRGEKCLMSNREATSGLGPIGNHNGDGINLHSYIAVAIGTNKEHRLRSRNGKHARMNEN